MKRLFIFLAALGFSMTLVSQGSGATMTVCPSGPPACDFSDIQAAVTASSNGDTIQVEDGLYDGFNTAGKSDLTIEALNPLGATVANTVLRNHTIDISAASTGSHHITIRGFVITQRSGVPGPRSAIIALRTNDCVIENSELYFIHQDSTTGRVIETHNGLPVTDNLIRNNNIWYNASAIYGNGGFDNNTITGNTFEGGSITLDPHVGYNLIDGNTFLGGSTGVWSFGHNNTIRNNTFTGYTSAAIVLAVYSNSGPPYGGNATIEDNDISNSRTGVYHGLDGYYGNTVYRTGDVIQYNEIHSCERGIFVWWAKDAQTHYNNIHDNDVGLRNYDNLTETYDATCNWWGAADGPSGLGPGSGDPVTDDLGQNLVEYLPWLVDPAPDGECLGGLDNEGPVALDLLLVSNPAAVDEPIALTATVDDSTTGGSSILNAEYSVDGGFWEAMVAQDGSFEDEVSEVVESTIPAFAEAGVHEVCVRGTDVAGNTGDEECIFLAVYDPDGGFVTGGGWIWSPPGAYLDDPGLEGKANFGFVSKYKKGAQVPTGSTEFYFKAGDLNFHSSEYDWLVVAGASAKYKGSGTINGGGDYGFMLTATDSAINGGGDVDTFRIKIWDKNDGDGVVYDNKHGDPDTSYDGTELGGGNIVVHKKK